jgi:hypothetical protein
MNIILAITDQFSVNSKLVAACILTPFYFFVITLKMLGSAHAQIHTQHNQHSPNTLVHSFQLILAYLFACIKSFLVHLVILMGAYRATFLQHLHLFFKIVTHNKFVHFGCSPQTYLVPFLMQHLLHFNTILTTFY